ncbi:hypothetical protein GCM10011579_038650 [Streptomyces albiflavescens]|uniref:Uncharacterized protein n=1 Tax=Streptomyces albiflavescens TaxID=1623582 RepID=A0A918D5V7_9ACTN|nr:hypothetical protein [Streptomyces albiflavescens]GGN66834.1 hypothetical protein GCM10011579_038650 [Streptomyces albiflavescens]
MGFFKNKTNDTPSNPAMAELGREYGIAKRHGDRKAMRRIAREVGANTVTDSDAESFRQGQQAYNSIPPAHSKPRRNRRS